MNTLAPDLTNRLLRGGLTLTAARLLTRGFDLARMLTIARWLGPDEMGVYAVATLALTALDQFSETGLRPALIQRPGELSAYLLPVRTLQIVRGLLLGGIVFLGAPWMAAFFDSPHSLDILRVMALLPVIKGFEPLFETLARKELRFAPVVALQTGASLISLGVGLVMAYLRPDAWALVLAGLSGAVVTTIGAHLFSERRSLGVSFDWRPLKDLRRYGFLIFINCLLASIFMKGGDWVIGRLLDVKALALYQMAFLICTTATTEIGGVVAQLAFPVFSHLQQDRDRLEKAFRQSFGMISVITLAMAGLIFSAVSLFGFYVLLLLLGQRWMEPTPRELFQRFQTLAGTFPATAPPPGTRPPQ